MAAPKPIALSYAAVSPTPNVAPQPFVVVGAPNGLRVVASGQATLVAGTVTVTNALALTGSVILLTPQTLSGVSAPTAVGVTARVNETSFTITSASVSDTSSIGYAILA